MVPRRYDEVLHAIECLPVLEPEVIFRPIQAVVFRAVDIPASRYITSDCGAHIDSPEIPSVFSAPQQNLWVAEVGLRQMIRSVLSGCEGHIIQEPGKPDRDNN
ncbi:hypothetical protein, partial [Thiolapillus sp.]|uniref:hypothetical protein n=2 Tax=Thiolapillus sp. TaxID=2017437 RepID=UPI003AF4D3BC